MQTSTTYTCNACNRCIMFRICDMFSYEAEYVTCSVMKLMQYSQYMQYTHATLNVCIECNIYVHPLIHLINFHCFPVIPFRFLAHSLICINILPRFTHPNFYFYFFPIRIGWPFLLLFSFFLSIFFCVGFFSTHIVAL